MENLPPSFDTLDWRKTVVLLHVDKPRHQIWNGTRAVLDGLANLVRLLGELSSGHLGKGKG
jgi:hypothetical protein